MQRSSLLNTTAARITQFGLTLCFILAVSIPGTLLGNQPPTVKIFTPLAGATFQAPATVFMAAWAQDLDGYLTIKTVEFFANSVSLGVCTNFPTLDPIGPFKISWNNVAAGDYVLTAKATDEWGATGVSDPVPIRVGSGLITGSLKREVYTNVPGLLVSDLTNYSGFPLKPDLVGTIESFEVPTQFGDNYGQRLSGYLIPAITGLYRFFVASDDQGVLFLSSDMDPAKKVQVAWESAWNFPRNWLDEPGRASAPIALEGGKAYYVEALHKEAGGGDNFAVAWQLPGGDPPVPGYPPIPGDYLAVMGGIPSNSPPFVAILQPQDDAVFSQDEAIHVAISAVGKGSSIAKVEVFSDAIRLGAATFQLSHWPTNFTFWWSNAPVGPHVLTARAEDAAGLASTSAPVRVTVRTNGPFPELHFKLAFSTLTGPGNGAVFYKDYTLNGPTGPGRLLPGMRIVPESGQRFMYAANPFSVLKVDSLTGLVVEMNPQGPGIPELSWPMGMAFDAVNNRALLASLGGEGFLYGYYVNEDAWALISSLHDLDLDSIVYHVADGAVYGFEVHRGVGPGSIYKLAADGTRARQIVLPPIPYDVGVSDHQSELVSVGDYLVLLIAPDFGLRAGPSKDSRMYVIDPRSGQSWLVFQQDDPANQPPSVAMLSPLSGATFDLGSEVVLQAKAEDPDSAIARVDFLANGTLIGQGTVSNGSVYVLQWEPPALGGHDVFARATDAEGAMASSQPIHLTVVPVASVLVPAKDDQQHPAVASDGTNFFAIWLDRRNHSGEDWTQCDVYGARITGDGTILDPNGLLLARNSVSASPPRIAYDGVNFLVVWERNLSGNLGPIRGSRVTPGGALLDGVDGFAIGKANGLLQSDPALAFNGRVWLVAWNDWRNQTNGIPNNLICDIYGARITAEGQVLDPENLKIVSAPLWQTSAGVAAMGTNFLVTCQDMAGVKAAFVGPAGEVSSAFEVSTRSGGSVARPVLASAGTNFLTAYEYEFNPGDNLVRSFILGGRLDPKGTSLDNGGLEVRTASGELNGSLFITSVRAGWRLAWHSRDIYTGKESIWAGGVDANGGVRAAVRVNALPVEHGRPAIGFNGRKLLVLWPDKRNADATQPMHLQFSDIFGTFLNLDGQVSDTNGFLVSSQQGVRLEVHWTTPAPIIYGALLGDAQLNATANVPGTFTYSPGPGTLLHVGAHRLSVSFKPTNPLLPVSTAAVTLTVTPAPLTIRANDLAKVQGTANPPLTASYSGFVGTDSPAVLDHPVTLSTPATEDSPPGVYPIIPSGASDLDYLITFVEGKLVIRSAGTTDGAVDLAFNGRLLGSVHALAVGPGGKVLAGGEFVTTGATLRTNLALFNEDGTVDPVFDATLRAHRVCALQPLSDGKFLVGSTGWSEPMNFPGLRRLLPDGSLDKGFLPGIQFGAWGAVRSIAVQPDGKILVGGLFRVQGVPRSVARLFPDGRLDETFDAGDIHYTDSDDFIVKSIFVQNDGRILVQGAIDKAQSQPVPGLFRLNLDGSFDETFNSQWSWVGSAMLLPDGKILAGGATSGYSSYGLFRLQTDGSIDSSFRPFSRVPVALALKSDGRILAAVPGRLTAYYQVFRLLEDGTPDESFHSGDGANGMINDLLVMPGGPLMVGGSFTAFDEVPAGGLARLINSFDNRSSFVTRSFSGATVTLTATPPALVQVYAVEDRLPPTWIATEISHGGVFDAVNGKVKFGPFFDHEPRSLTYVAKGLLPPGSGTVCGFEGTASADGLPSPILGESCMRIIQPHPADLGPTDWRMALDEVTAYGAAWKTGGVWQVEPNPIPMDYVTRAAALWRGGEAYQVDVRLGGPPAWWVNLNRPTKLVARHSETAPSVVRLAPEGVAPGDSLDVAIRAEPGSSTAAYAVEEALPSGTTVSWTGQGGVFDPVQKLIKWGPFFDSNPRLLEYQLTTGTNAQTLVFWGKGSFDGNPTVLGGTSSARYGARLAWGGEPAAQNPTLTLRGFPGATYVLEWSSDMVHWTTFSTVSNLIGEARIPVDSLNASSQRYYRARQLP